MSQPLAPMKVEIEAGTYYLTYLMSHGIDTQLVTSEQLDIFRRALNYFLEAYYRSHWHSDQPDRGSGYRCLRLNSKIDPLIIRAGLICGWDELFLWNLFPRDLTIWIDPEEVSCRIGENGYIHTLFDGKNNLTKPEAQPRDFDDEANRKEWRRRVVPSPCASSEDSGLSPERGPSPNQQEHHRYDSYKTTATGDGFDTYPSCYADDGSSSRLCGTSLETNEMVCPGREDVALIDNVVNAPVAMNGYHEEYEALNNHYQATYDYNYDFHYEPNYDLNYEPEQTFKYPPGLPFRVQPPTPSLSLSLALHQQQVNQQHSYYQRREEELQLYNRQQPQGYSYVPAERPSPSPLSGPNGHAFQPFPGHWVWTK